ncbi:MAG: hypothetical protein K2N41_04930 [Lachnospiraceae bacterium]|nr:hypothetical protein [Lachnospiraceae bacterium]MDE7239037.1 hypothetical protein [Lachnospiraceae bacterium]
MIDRKSYLKQIDQFYSHRLNRFASIYVGTTPDVLVSYGAPKLPLVIRQSILTKCIRKATGSRSAHELPRDVIENLPEQMEHPIFLIRDKARDSIALISDYQDQNNNSILIAIKLNEDENSMKVNSIKSIYGKASLKEYLQKNAELQQLHIIDNKKAERLSRLVGFQLPQALIASSHNMNLSPGQKNVNNKISVLDKLESNKKRIHETHPEKMEKSHERHRERE